MVFNGLKEVLRCKKLVQRKTYYSPVFLNLCHWLEFQGSKMSLNHREHQSYE